MQSALARRISLPIALALLLVAPPAGAQDPQADLGVSIEVQPDPAEVGEELRYRAIVTNHGPGHAEEVLLTMDLDPSLRFASARAGRGGRCTHSGGEQGGTVECTLQRLDKRRWPVEVLAEATETGEVTTTATVESSTPDPDESNDQAQASSTVEGEDGSTAVEPGCDADWCPIQPGALLGDQSSGFCTMGFLFRDEDSGRLLMSTAAHCTEGVGERMHAEEEEETFRMEEEAFGTVVFRTGDEEDLGLDFAMIEIDLGREGDVSAEVRHFTGPIGVAEVGETALGDMVMYYGYGLLFDFTPELRPRRGLLMNHDEREYQSNSAGMFGDSGAAVLHESGQALGLISRFNVLEDGVSTDLGPTVQGMIALLESEDRDVTLVDADVWAPPLLP